MTYTIKEEIIPKGRQRYFFVAITEDDKLEIINELPTQKFNGRKTIDIYTASHTKEEIVKQLEGKIQKKLIAIRLGYRRNDGKVVLLGMVVNNKDFANSIKNFERGKVDRINRNSNIFAKELYEFEQTIENNINEIEKIYGPKSPIYIKAVNFKENNNLSLEHRMILIEEFSQYTNFRKWLTRKTEAIYPIVEQTRYPGQITINDYFGATSVLPNIPDTSDEYPDDYILENHKPTEEELMKEALLKFNTRNPDKEEFIEKEDVTPDSDMIEDCKPSERKKYKR